MKRTFAIVTMALISITPVLIVATLKLVDAMPSTRPDMAPNSALLVLPPEDGGGTSLTAFT